MKDAVVADSFLNLYVCAVIAACHTEFYTYPLDLVKTRLQIQGVQADKIGTGPQRGMLGTALGIIKAEGIFGLWSGIGAIFARHSVYAGTRMVVYNEMRDFFKKRTPPGEKLKFWHLVVSGCTCGFIAQFVASPTDVIKVQLQMEGKRKQMGLPPRVTGVWSTFLKVYRKGGIRGLWIGWIPNCQRAVLVNLGDFTAYDTAKRSIQEHTRIKDNILLHSLASMCAGVVGSVLSTPADVIKSRVMNQPVGKDGKGLLYKGTWDCFKKSVKEEGFVALYKGFIPTLMRLGPWAIINWVSYEQLRIFIGAKSF